MLCSWWEVGDPGGEEREEVSERGCGQEEPPGLHLPVRACQCSVFSVQGSGLRFEGSGLRVEGAGLRVEGLGLRVEGCGIRVEG